MKSWKMVERKEVTEELIDLMTSQQGKVGLMLGGKSIGFFDFILFYFFIF